jgi:hypothetical protein
MVLLGSEVRDSMTGFAGVVVSRTEYLYGCVSVGVQPAGLSPKGKPEGIVYFDEQRLDGESEAPVGGPGDHPPQRATPPGR